MVVVVVVLCTRVLINLPSSVRLSIRCCKRRANVRFFLSDQISSCISQFCFVHQPAWNRSASDQTDRPISKQSRVQFTRFAWLSFVSLTSWKRKVLVWTFWLSFRVAAFSSEAILTHTYLSDRSEQLIDTASTAKSGCSANRIGSSVELCEHCIGTQAELSHDYAVKRRSAVSAIARFLCFLAFRNAFFAQQERISVETIGRSATTISIAISITGTQERQST